MENDKPQQDNLLYPVAENWTLITDFFSPDALDCIQIDEKQVGGISVLFFDGFPVNCVHRGAFAVVANSKIISNQVTMSTGHYYCHRQCPAFVLLKDKHNNDYFTINCVPIKKTRQLMGIMTLKDLAKQLPAK